MALTTVQPGMLGTPQPNNFKNRIINGAMVISQYNGTASVTPTADTTYVLDRWQVAISQASKFSVQQNAGSVTPPVGFTNYLGATSLSAYSVLTGDYFCIDQRIEGFNTADLGWGTANAKTVTLSFQVYSSLTGTFGGAITNNAFSYSYPFSYSIPVANTWTTVSVTIAGPTAGVWVGATNTASMRIYFGLGVGATYSGTAGSWSANGYASATGATSVVGTNGATFYITGVQLEVGNNATGFDYRPYGTELALCQRYYYVAISGQSYSIVGWFNTSAQARATFAFPVTMRANPTLVSTTGTNYYDFFGATGDYLTNAVSLNPASPNYGNIYATISGATPGQGCGLYTYPNSYIAFQAEL